jgi:hypothetical protein
MKLRIDLHNFDCCPQYNDWLDQQYFYQSGSLSILGFEPRPSLILYTLSQDTYQAGFDDFQLQRQEDLKQTVFDDFPSPIAHYFYRFENGYENELQRLYLLRDTWESLIDVLHAMAVAEIRFKRVSLTAPIAYSHFLTDSVAQRLLNVERIIGQASDQGISLEIAKIVTIATLATMRDLNQTRNGFSHSAAQSEVQALTWIAECYDDVLDVLDDVRGLAHTEILRYIGQVNGSTLRCEVFSGHGFTRTIRNVALATNQVHESHQYFQLGQVLVSYEKSIFGLRPLVYYREDASGHTTKLCMFRRIFGDAPDRRVSTRL